MFEHPTLAVLVFEWIIKTLLGDVVLCLNNFGRLLEFSLIRVLFQILMGGRDGVVELQVMFD